MASAAAASSDAARVPKEGTHAFGPCANPHCKWNLYQRFGCAAPSCKCASPEHSVYDPECQSTSVHLNREYCSAGGFLLPTVADPRDPTVTTAVALDFSTLGDTETAALLSVLGVRVDTDLPAQVPSTRSGASADAVAQRWRAARTQLLTQTVTSSCRTACIEEAELARGRAHGSRTDREHSMLPHAGGARLYWHRIPAQLRTCEAGFAALPENAVLCHGCECSLRQTYAPEDFDRDSRKYVFENAYLLTRILCPEAIRTMRGLLTLQSYLLAEGDRMLHKRAVWVRHERTAGGWVQWSNSSASGQGGNAQLSSLAGGLLHECVRMCQRGLPDVISQLEQQFGTPLWAAFGALFNNMLSDATVARGKLIEEGHLHSLTNWRVDWETNVPAPLREFLWHAVSSRKERRAIGGANPMPSGSRLLTKFNMRYALSQDFLHALDPACNQPLQVATGRMVSIHGRSKLCRDLLTSLGRTDSHEAGRVRQILDASDSGGVRHAWLEERLRQGQVIREQLNMHREEILARREEERALQPVLQTLMKLFATLCIAVGLVDDNLDWAGALSRLHSIDRSRFDRSIHILQRTVRVFKIKSKSVFLFKVYYH